MDRGCKAILKRKLEALSPWGLIKTKGKLAQGTRLRESLENGKKGRSATKHKKAKTSNRNRHSRNKSHYRSKDKRNQKDLEIDDTFEKIQWKNACVMGPLSKLCMLVEEARRSKENQIAIDLDNIRAYIEKTVLLLGQTSNYITYFRSYNILAALNCPAQSKEMLSEEPDLLQWHDGNLFGKKFSEHLVASAK